MGRTLLKRLFVRPIPECQNLIHYRDWSGVLAIGRRERPAVNHRYASCLKESGGHNIVIRAGRLVSRGDDRALSDQREPSHAVEQWHPTGQRARGYSWHRANALAQVFLKLSCPGLVITLRIQTKPDSDQTGSVERRSTDIHALEQPHGHPCPHQQHQRDPERNDHQHIARRPDAPGLSARRPG